LKLLEGPKMPNSLSKKRLAAFQRQQGLCYYCGFPMWLVPQKEVLDARLQCTAEHLVARQNGGSDSSDNIVAACRFCNQTRHRTPRPLEPELYRERVSRRVHAGRWHPAHLFEINSGRSSVKARKSRR